MKFRVVNKLYIINEILEYGAHLIGDSDHLEIDSIIKRGGEFNIKCRLPEGKHTLTYLDKSVSICYERSNAVVGTAVSATRHEIVSIDISRNLINRFMEDARTFCKIKPKNDEAITHLYVPHYWRVLSKLPKRSLNTIYIDETVKGKIVRDIDIFLNSRDKYVNYGIPYKRNYLFEGLHGTGKTSFIYALASHFNKGVAIINFSNDLNDDGFMKAISKVPDDSFLVLEDIDSLFSDRKIHSKTMITFSGMLNILDGVARKDGQITFITTNYANRLDRALVRPGRIDFKLHFTYAKRGEIKRIFFTFFPERDELWKDFWGEIRRLKLTIACLQNFLFSSGENILERIEDIKKMAMEITENTKPLYT